MGSKVRDGCARSSILLAGISALLAACPQNSAVQNASPEPAVMVVSPATAAIGVQPRQGQTAATATSVQLSASVVVNGAASTSGISWSSLDPTVATVNASGLVTAGTATGSARIVATSGKATASATVTVGEAGSAGTVID